MGGAAPARQRLCSSKALFDIFAVREYSATKPPRWAGWNSSASWPERGPEPMRSIINKSTTQGRKARRSACSNPVTVRLPRRRPARLRPCARRCRCVVGNWRTDRQRRLRIPGSASPARSRIWPKAVFHYGRPDAWIDYVETPKAIRDRYRSRRSGRYDPAAGLELQRPGQPLEEQGRRLCKRLLRPSLILGRRLGIPAA